MRPNLRRRDYMTSAKVCRTMRFVEFLPGSGQKPVEITKIAQIAARLLFPADGHLYKKRHMYVILDLESRTINTNISCSQNYLLLLLS